MTPWSVRLFIPSGRENRKRMRGDGVKALAVVDGRKTLERMKPMRGSAAQEPSPALGWSTDSLAA